MRNISFSLTLDSFANGTKDVTRRKWKKQWVKPGDHMMAVEKAQGLGKGGKIKRLGEIVIRECSPERVDEIIRNSHRPTPVTIYPGIETGREGFPAFTPEQFVEFFCRANKCKPDTIIYRIVFAHVKPKNT
jgi:hypothetical protein